ncbi:MAG: hypothetical protein AAGF49_09305 [Pseudomonadota bacterium]
MRGPLCALAVMVVVANLLVPSMLVLSGDAGGPSGWMCAGDETGGDDTGHGLRCNSCCMSAVLALVVPGFIALRVPTRAATVPQRPALVLIRTARTSHARIRAPPAG